MNNRWSGKWSSVTTCVGWMALWAGCAQTAPAPVSNAALGIAEFRTEETAERTTIVALDAEKHEVGKVDLVHGRFLTEKGEEAVGRQLKAEMRGQPLSFETVGFEDKSHMRALPNTRVTALLADPHVRPVLDRWLIGWTEAASAAEQQSLSTGGSGETPYTDWCWNGGLCSGNQWDNWASWFDDNDGHGVVWQCCGDANNGTWVVKACECGRFPQCQEVTKIGYSNGCFSTNGPL